MDDVGALTRRFHDFIDKLQFAIDTIKGGGSVAGEMCNNAANIALCSAYAVSPAAGDVECSLETLFSSIDNAIENIEKVFISQGVSSEETSANTHDGRACETDAAMIPSPGNVIFTPEELTFLEQTFHTILNTPHDERKRLYERIELQEQ